MSARVANPIIRKIEDTQDALDFFESVTLPAEDIRICKRVRGYIWESL